jgi:hypothetical protein
MISKTAAERLEIARRIYKELVAQNPNRMITLRDGAGKVVARHDPLPEHDAPGIASQTQGDGHDG